MKTTIIILACLMFSPPKDWQPEVIKQGGFKYGGDSFRCVQLKTMSLKEWLAR